MKVHRLMLLLFTLCYLTSFLYAGVPVSVSVKSFILHNSGSQFLVNMAKEFLLLEIGSTEDYWKRVDAAQVIALVEYTYLASILH